jgi:hypothetical protein
MDHRRYSASSPSLSPSNAADEEESHEKMQRQLRALHILRHRLQFVATVGYAYCLLNLQDRKQPEVALK